MQGCVLFLTTSVKSLLKLHLLCITTPHSARPQNSPLQLIASPCVRVFVHVSVHAFLSESWSPKWYFWAAMLAMKWCVMSVNPDWWSLYTLLLTYIPLRLLTCPNTHNIHTQRLQGVPGQNETDCELQMNPKTELLLSDKWDKHTLALCLSLSFGLPLTH